MIVKNEAANIKRAIESVLLCADEVIVNDTGSTDGTQEIAAGLSPRVKVIHNPWQDNFALARNQSIEAASCEWVMWIDGDDFLTFQQAEQVIILKRAPLDRYFNFKVINTKHGIPCGSQFLQARMFPRRPDVRFAKRVHEEIITACMVAGLAEISVPVEIWHYGYETDEARKAKAERNGRLMSAAGYERGTMSERRLIAENYYILEQWEAGIDILLGIVQSEKSMHPHLRLKVITQIGHGFQRLGKFADAIQWYDQVEAEFIEAKYQKAQCLQSLGMLDDALNTYLDCIKMPDKIYLLGSDYNFCKMYSCHFAFHILMSQGKNKEAFGMMDYLHRNFPQFIMSTIYD
jgi:tetratricopeptide (TPR) repeat protein